MPFATLPDGLELEYLRQGDPDGPTVLMVMGLGAQRTWWPEELLAGLADEGFDVVSFDNRDVGLSTGFEDAGPVGLDALMARLAGDHSVVPPYTLADMAADAVGLLDALAVERAHVVGASMGGMIVQHLGFGHPDRVASVTSIMSNSGARDSGQATPEATQVLLTPAPADRDAYVEQTVRSARIIGSNRFFDEERTRERAAAFFDRAYRPTGTGRQLLAILADGDRTERLAGITAPTLVLHGADDTLIQPDGGEAVASAVPDAKLVVLDDMGHDFPLPVIPDVVSLVAAHVRRAEAG